MSRPVERAIGSAVVSHSFFDCRAESDGERIRRQDERISERNDIAVSEAEGVMSDLSAHQRNRKSMVHRIRSLPSNPDTTCSNPSEVDLVQIVAHFKRRCVPPLPAVQINPKGAC
jgi:hypothetical protein